MGWHIYKILWYNTLRSNDQKPLQDMSIRVLLNKYGQHLVWNILLFFCKKNVTFLYIMIKTISMIHCKVKKRNIGIHSALMFKF